MNYLLIVRICITVSCFLFLSTNIVSIRVTEKTWYMVIPPPLGNTNLGDFIYFRATYNEHINRRKENHKFIRSYDLIFLSQRYFLTMATPETYNGSLPNNNTNVLTFSNGNRTIPLVIIGGIAIGSMLVHLFITFILKQIAKKTGWAFDKEVVKHW